MDVKKKILYLTYDGLTDPLGQSQILPYLIGLSKEGYEFTIISFEKEQKFSQLESEIRELTTTHNIKWVPLRFTSKPPLLSKFYDAIKMKTTASRLQKKYGFDAVHCRGYVSSDAGLMLKRKFGIPFIFDMRGFWADEKKDGGSWNTDNFVFSRVYKYYKKKEKEFIQSADQIISLTEAGKREISTWSSYNAKTPLAVVPCCADMRHFSLNDNNQKKQARQAIGVSEDSIVLSYLGSIGAWYMIDEMLAFYKKFKEKYPTARFLVVTHSPHALIAGSIAKAGLNENDFIILEASRSQVPLYLKASDINICFIKPVYSKISSSPTKLAEVLAMGIPVIYNSGVGDVKEIIETSGAGIVIDDFTDSEYQRAIELVPALLKKQPEEIRNSIETRFSLQTGIEKYSQCYEKLFRGKNTNE